MGRRFTGHVFRLVCILQSFFATIVYKPFFFKLPLHELEQIIKLMRILGLIDLIYTKSFECTGLSRKKPEFVF